MNSLSVIPFYRSVEEQDFRKAWAYGQVFTLPVSRNYLLPFSFSIDGGAEKSVKSVEIFRSGCGETQPFYRNGDFNEDFDLSFNVYGSGDWTKAIKNNGLYTLASGTSSVTTTIYYCAEENLPLNLPKGQYYLRIVLEGDLEYFSEVFTCVDDADLSKYLKITWRSYDNLEFYGGFLPYEDEYYNNVLYLDTDVGMPEYPFEEEGETRNGYFFATKQISYKKYKFNFIAPEYLCDAMRIIRMSDYIAIVDPLGRWYVVTSFLLNDPEWLEQGHYANVDCEFTTDTIVKVMGRAI